MPVSPDLLLALRPFDLLAILLLGWQLPATALLLARLLPGIARKPALVPRSSTLTNLGQVSIVVPTLNEAQRLPSCLAGLSRQGYEVREILVVDSNSQDGTPDLVKAAAQRDPRYHLLTDDPLPVGWVGRPWALHTGFLHSHEESEWVLGIDADTQPQPGLVASLLQIAQAEQWDLISLSPKFILKSFGEWWLQPSLLLTLIYRFGARGDRPVCPERLLANGQCLLIRRSLLVKMGGYSSARQSFCDDVTLVRQAAALGAKVAFLDGGQLLQVRMYEGMAETWREWGRSLDLKDATPVAQLWGDLGFLLAVQGLPLPMSLCLGLAGLSSLSIQLAWGLNLCLVGIRLGMLAAIAGSYDWQKATGRRGFWLSPFSDPLAVLRILLSSLQTPKQWRGRTYSTIGSPVSSSQ
uniref:4,4'-diaponeurosporenoate glycosyltransferase n=1 Tax=Cyanothece sp. (strain PCC 7425 / ATCC 29141) TaxID=395961 RepID=B8HY63_CYAP4